MKIFDCFTFYNEFDLLELRLRELYNHVDHFVIVEGNTTFTNVPKPFYFDENRARFEPWTDKIIYVQVTDMPRDANTWANETFQRNAIMRGLDSAEPEDIIIVSDVDELIRPSTIDAMRSDVDSNVWGLRMPTFNFKLNYMLVTSELYFVWAMAARKKHLVPPEQLRHQRFALNGFLYGYHNSGVALMEHAGWHFTYLGDTKFAENKIKSFSHTETNTPEIIAQLDVERSIENGDGIYHHPGYKYSAVLLDSYFPETVLRNVEQYSGYILTKADKSALDFLPH